MYCGKDPLGEKKGGEGVKDGKSFCQKSVR